MPSRSLLCAAAKRLRAKNSAATRSAARFASVIRSRACSASSRGPEGTAAPPAALSRSRAGGLGRSVLLAGGGGLGRSVLLAGGGAGAGEAGDADAVFLIFRAAFGAAAGAGGLISLAGPRSSLAFLTASALDAGAAGLSARAPGGAEGVCQ